MTKFKPCGHIDTGVRCYCEPSTESIANSNHTHDFAESLWRPMPGTAPGFEQQLYCYDHKCECGELRFGRLTDTEKMDGDVVSLASLAQSEMKGDLK